MSGSTDPLAVEHFYGAAMTVDRSTATATRIPLGTGHRPVTTGHLPAEPGGMLTETRPARPRTAAPVLWALTSGIAGLVANVLLVLFFLLAQPFGVNGPLAARRARTSCGLAAPTMW